MIYLCDHCGASFNEKEIETAASSTTHAIRCRFCNNITVIDQTRPSYISQAYDCLTRANFAEAQRLFSIVIETNPSSRLLTEAYLGELLAVYQVQTIFESNDDIRSRFPKLVMCEYNSLPVGSNALYNTALKEIEKTSDKNAEAKLRYYVKFIDGVHRYYRYQQNKEYDICIAYDMSGVTRAIKIKNKLLDNIANDRIYMAGVDAMNAMGSSCLGEEEFESYIEIMAKNLYARDHSRGMVIVSDNEVLSARLVTLYSGFYRKKGNSDRSLCFALNNNATIMLPNQNYASHIFVFYGVNDDYTPCVNFLYNVANILVTTVVQNEELSKEENLVETGNDFSAAFDKDLSSDNRSAVKEGNIIKFGTYPQSRVTDVDIIKVFGAFNRPNIEDSNGWRALFTNINGVTYTWIRDEIIQGEKYRGVYFTQFREQSSDGAYNSSDVPQREAGYFARRITCYKFEDISWRILNKSEHAYRLAPETALDCMPITFGKYDEYPFITDWLNENFAQVAFSENELDCIFRSNNDEKVFLIGQTDLAAYQANGVALACSDYCLCMGVLCNNNSARRYWIYNDDQQCASVYDTYYRSSYTYGNLCDNQIAVIPKITLNSEAVI